ncbi:MAG: hypothetical protein Q7T55_18050 [Solirubrobacteraceae bacterium]|nr:hypothetical protein [Solirubrobacteraceae bacterium]
MALAAAGAWFYSHGGRQAPENVTKYPLDGQFLLSIENGGDDRIGEDLPVQLILRVSGLGRELTVRPTWPRSAFDPRRCFVPDAVRLDANIEGRLGFALQFIAHRERADAPWRTEARFRGGAPQPTVLEKQAPGDTSLGAETSGRAIDCPQWRVKLPARAVITGKLTSSNGTGLYGASPLDSREWKAISRRAADAGS